MGKIKTKYKINNNNLKIKQNENRNLRILGIITGVLVFSALALWGVLGWEAYNRNQLFKQSQLRVEIAAKRADLQIARHDSIIKLESTLRLEENTFRIDSKDWKIVKIKASEIFTEKEIKGIEKCIVMKVNANKDVWEYVAGVPDALKGEQIFTYQAALRETKKAGRKMIQSYSDAYGIAVIFNQKKTDKDYLFLIGGLELKKNYDVRFTQAWLSWCADGSLLQRGSTCGTTIALPNTISLPNRENYMEISQIGRWNDKVSNNQKVALSVRCLKD